MSSVKVTYSINGVSYNGAADMNGEARGTAFRPGEAPLVTKAAGFSEVTATSPDREWIARLAEEKDLFYLRSSLALLSEEMEELLAASKLPLEQGVNSAEIETCLARDTFLVAEKEGVLAGHISLYYPHVAPRVLIRSPRSAFINTIYVNRNFRRRGIATVLLKRAASECKAWGATGIALSLLEGNFAAEHLYRRAGYTITRHQMALSLSRS